MLVVVLSDIHSNKEMIKKIAKSIHNKVDSALFLGDFTNFGDGSAARIVESIEAKQCYAIPGNLDSWEIAREIEAMGISLHGKSVKLGAFSLIGFGGGLHGNPGEVLYSEEQIMKAIEPLLQKAENPLLATHLPPKNTPLDLTYNGMHVGSTAVRKAIEKFKPSLHLCGHIHEAAGETKIGKTHCINVGAAKEGNALILELDDEVSFKKVKV